MWTYAYFLRFLQNRPDKIINNINEFDANTTNVVLFYQTVGIARVEET